MNLKCTIIDSIFFSVKFAVLSKFEFPFYHLVRPVDECQASGNHGRRQSVDRAALLNSKFCRLKWSGELFLMSNMATERGAGPAGPRPSWPLRRASEAAALIRRICVVFQKRPSAASVDASHTRRETRGSRTDGRTDGPKIINRLCLVRRGRRRRSSATKM